MKGTLQKTMDASALACQTCRHFRDDDPDLFYCAVQRAEFPALCDEYAQAEPWADARREWTMPDEL